MARGSRLRQAPTSTVWKNSADVLVEGRRLFEIDGVAGVRHHDQCGGRNCPLHEKARLETGPIFVARHDQRRHGDGLHLVHEIEQRRSPFLHAAHGARRPFG